MARPIVFLSDYGLDDEFVGICHGVMARISPESRIIDLTHAVPPQDVLRGGLVLAQSLPYLPPEAVFLAVVDPGVGTFRRPLAVETAEHGALLVGPDNGLLSMAWVELGGVARAVEIRSEDVVLEPVSRTFHGRDVFAPAAAHLARGLPLDVLGPAVEPESLVETSVPDPGVEGRRIHAEVLGVDRYGNVQLSVRLRHLEAAGLSEAADVVVGGPQGSVRVVRASTFGDVTEGQLAGIVDSAGWLSVVLNRGSAAEALGLSPGDPVTLGQAENAP